MAIINTLEEWHKNMLQISSPLLIRPVIKREVIDFIYRELKGCFGEKFFNIKQNTDMPLEKSLWINQLLANKKHLGSIGALNHIALLIEYAKNSDKKLYQEIIRLKKNPRNLRTFFFELFIYNLLDTNKIINNKKPVINNQELEGTCELNDNIFLFECRKVFMPKIDELDIIKRLLEVFFLNKTKINKPIGMICGIKMKRPIKSVFRNSFEEKINTFFLKFNSSNNFDTIDYTITDEAGTFKVCNYSKEALIEAQEIIKYDALFYLIPEESKSNITYLRGASQGNFQVAQTEIYKKIESILKEKRKQHQKSPIKNQIIFIDTEIFPGLDLDVFQTDTSLDINMLKKSHNNTHKESILCITRRIYTKLTPEIQTLVIYPKYFDREVNHLMSCFKGNNLIII